MVGIVGLVLLVLGVFVFVLGRVPTIPGRAEAFASHVFAWRSHGTGMPKLCVCALVLSGDKLVIFILGFPKVVIRQGEVSRVQYYGGRGLVVETGQFKLRLFPRYVAEWHALIVHHLRAEQQ